MEKINFSAGDEEKAIEFLKSISGNDKVALVSHTDLDGISCVKVLDKVVNPKIVKFIDYEEIRNELVDELKNSGVNKVIFSDLLIESLEVIKEIESFAEVLIVDHHKFETDFNSEKCVFVSAEGYCAAYLCYYLVSKIKNIDEIDWLVACACVADWQFFKNADFMIKVFEKYGDKFEAGENSLRKSGKFWDANVVLSYANIYFKSNNGLDKFYEMLGDDFSCIVSFRGYSEAVDKEIKKWVVKFDSEKEVFEDVYFFMIGETEFGIKSIVSNILSDREHDKTFIFMERNNSFVRVSARRQDGKVDLSGLLKSCVADLEEGMAGGHFRAAGANFLVNDLDKFRENFKKFYHDFVVF